MVHFVSKMDNCVLNHLMLCLTVAIGYDYNTDNHTG
ncbi:hypothetical protein SAMN05421636_10518 [Pricia antarctica]|uniref:Uncharacterized protein n=1 Tax=Pricia antarctica TaxID=641691 RepID=A0A1G7CT60_9FLAO|nr:hypothetical protein SAMN05421636_10518 [Pricia antarctica]